MVPTERCPQCGSLVFTHDPHDLARQVPTPLDWLAIRDWTERAMAILDHVGARARIPASELGHLQRARQLLHQVLVALPRHDDPLGEPSDLERRP